MKDTINLMRHSIEFGHKNFLIGNPAYFQNTDAGVYSFYSNIIKAVPESCIILYNFNKLMNFTFSVNLVKKLVNEYGDNIVGCKDSSSSVWDKIKLPPSFSMFVGTEIKLLKNLELAGAGVISATTNVTHSLARKVYDDFKKKKKVDNKIFEKLCAIRKAYEETGNLITALHYSLSINDKKYKNLLPPLVTLNQEKTKGITR